MRQYIQTKYIGPTNTRSGRVKASANPGSIFVSWNHALGIEENHIAAAKAYAAKYDWKGVWSGGGGKDGYCFVQASEHDFCI